jgi:hypothetical protein
MKFSRLLVATAIFSLFLPLSLLAKDNSNKHSIKTQISQPATVAGTALAPGQYKVEWTGTGPAVNAEFKLNGKTVATAPATVSELGNGSAQNAVAYQKSSDGSQAITEITGKKEALKFGTEASTGNPGAAQ